MPCTTSEVEGYLSVTSLAPTKAHSWKITTRSITPQGFSGITTTAGGKCELNTVPQIVRKGNSFKWLLYLLLFEELTMLIAFPGLGYNTLPAQPSSYSLRPPIWARLYSILPGRSSYRTDNVFMSHHAGTLMVTVAFNIHSGWIILHACNQIPGAWHPHACCL